LVTSKYETLIEQSRLLGCIDLVELRTENEPKL